MTTRDELIEWLSALPQDADVAIDDGGLTIFDVHSGAYYEVGGEARIFEIWRVFKDSGRDQLLEAGLTKAEAHERASLYEPADGFIVVIDGEEN